MISELLLISRSYGNASMQPQRTASSLYTNTSQTRENCTAAELPCWGLLPSQYVLRPRSYDSLLW